MEGFNYASQIRLVILLLLLFLVLLNLQITYLFEQTKRRLNQELESRLNLAALVVRDRWQETEAKRGAKQGEEILPNENPIWLRTWAGKSGLDRILILEREGKTLAIEANGRASFLDRPGLAGEDPGLWKRAWEGETVSTPIYRDPDQGFHKALFLPLRRSRGEIVGLLGVVAPADFLGNISRISSFIFYGFLLGIPAALIISLFFIDFVLRPYRRLSLATPSSTGEAMTSPDVETIVSTYERTIQALREKELEMSALYQMEQKRAQELENYQSDLLSNISSGVLSLDPTYRIQVCNEVARDILGLLELQIQGHDARQVFAGMPELVTLLEETLTKGKIHQRRELEIEKEKNERSWIGLSSSLLKGEAGMIEGAIFLLTDLTEIRALQEQMRISENLAALGEMSAGVAHEFRNSLSAILGQCQLLQRRLPEGSLGQKTLGEMAAEILTLEGIIREFLRFARPQDLKIQPLDLADFFRELEASFVETLAEARVKVALLPCPEVTIGADTLALRQAMVNLIQNSQEAMPQGGELSISVAMPKRRQGWRRGKVPADSAFVKISVSDNGRGMDEEERKKAFLPFFTTKEKGTGLGLALVQKAIVGMRGKIEVESEVGVGTTFHLYLPLISLGDGKSDG